MEGKEEDVKLGANKFAERQPIGTAAQSQDKDYKEPPPAPLFEPGELRSWSFYRAGIAEFMATEARPRSLRQMAVPLAPLLEESIASVNAQLGPAVRRWRVAPDFAGMTLRADRRALRGALHQVLARAARLTRDGDWIDLRPVLTRALG